VYDNVSFVAIRNCCIKILIHCEPFFHKYSYKLKNKMNYRTYKELMEIYQQMHVDEARRNAGTGGGGKTAKYVQNASSAPVGHVQDRPKKGGEDVDKGEASSKFINQLAADKTAARGITPEQRRERARQNKEKKAKAGIDSLLKDIRGK